MVRQMKILVVHHDRSIADDLAEFLFDHGYRVLPLYDAADGFDQVFMIEFDFALVSLSVLASEELGIVLSDRCTVVFLGLCHEVENMRARNPEFDYLAMPFEKEELLSKIEGCVTNLKFLKSAGAEGLVTSHTNRKYEP